MQRFSDLFPGNLDESSFVISTRTVLTGSFLIPPQCGQKLLFMFLPGHIYEINDDNAGQVSQTELAGRLGGCLQVDFQYRILGILLPEYFPVLTSTVRASVGSMTR